MRFLKTALALCFVALCWLAYASDTPTVGVKRSEPTYAVRSIRVIAGPGITSHGVLSKLPMSFVYAHIEAFNHLGPWIRFYQKADLGGWVGSVYISDPTDPKNRLVFVKRVRRTAPVPTVAVRQACRGRTEMVLTFPTARALRAWEKGVEAGFATLQAGEHRWGNIGNYGPQ